MARIRAMTQHTAELRVSGAGSKPARQSVRIAPVVLQYDDNGDPICDCGWPGYACRCCPGCGQKVRHPGAHCDECSLDREAP